MSGRRWKQCQKNAQRDLRRDSANKEVIPTSTEDVTLSQQHVDVNRLVQRNDATFISPLAESINPVVAPLIWPLPEIILPETQAGLCTILDGSNHTVNTPIPGLVPGIRNFTWPAGRTIPSTQIPSIPPLKFAGGSLVMEPHFYSGNVDQQYSRGLPSSGGGISNLLMEGQQFAATTTPSSALPLFARGRMNTTSGIESNIPRSTNPFEKLSGEVPIHRSLGSSSGGGVIETTNNSFPNTASTSSGSEHGNNSSGLYSNLPWNTNTVIGSLRGTSSQIGVESDRCCTMNAMAKNVPPFSTYLLDGHAGSSDILSFGSRNTAQLTSSMQLGESPIIQWPLPSNSNVVVEADDHARSSDRLSFGPSNTSQFSTSMEFQESPIIHWPLPSSNSIVVDKRRPTSSERPSTYLNSLPSAFSTLYFPSGSAVSGQGNPVAALTNENEESVSMNTTHRPNDLRTNRQQPQIETVPLNIGSSNHSIAGSVFSPGTTYDGGVDTAQPSTSAGLRRRKATSGGFVVSKDVDGNITNRRQSRAPQTSGGHIKGYRANRSRPPCRPVTQSTVPSLSDRQPPTREQLRQFERDPAAALLALVINSGNNRFSATSELYGDGNVIDPSVDAVREAIDRLDAEMKSAFEDSDGSDPRGRIMNEFQKAMNMLAPLYACACCGIREFVIDRDDNPAYLDVDLRKLSKLQYKKEQLDHLLSIRDIYRPVVSHFKSRTGIFYHLHPEFVTVENDQEVAKICASCFRVLEQKGTKIPQQSIAAGVDYGVASRIGLPPLSLAEQYVIARARLYASIVKLTAGNSSQQQNFRKGHVITFPQQESADLIAEHARAYNSKDDGVYPRIEGLCESIGVTFIGSKAQWKALVPDKSMHRLGHVQELQVRSDVVMRWLRALKCLNPFYSNIVVDDSAETCAALDRIADDILRQAVIASSEKEIAMDRIATAEYRTDCGMHASEPAGEQELSQNGQLPSVFVLKPAHGNSGAKNSASARVLRSVSKTLCDGSHSPAENDGFSEGEEGCFSSEPNTCNSDEVVEERETNRCATEEDRPAKSRIDVPIGSQPMNEFEANPKLFYSAFPSLFLLGRGLRKEGSVPAADCRHMLLQFTCNFATCPRLIFCLLDQLQRHAASRTVAARFRNTSESLEKLQNWVGDQQFMEDLKRAMKNPESKDSKILLAKITPHIKTISSEVPYSPAQRKASMAHLYSMAHHFGLPSVFITYAPDFVNGVLNLRMSLPSTSNTGLPAEDDGLLDSLRNQQSVHKTVKLSQACLNEKLVDNPVAMAEFFKMMTDNIFTILFGMKPDGHSKYTPGLADRPVGLFGIPIAAFGVVEEQARGTPHCHAIVWGGLPPSLLQSTSAVPDLLGTIAKLLDKMVTAELEIKTMAKHLLDQFPGGIVSNKPCQSIPHNPVTHPTEFENDVQLAAAYCNIHGHSTTCHKTKLGDEQCRLGRPAPEASETHVVQLIPFRDAQTKKVDYTVSKEPLPPRITSLPGRDFSRVPVANRDLNLHFWELKRRDHHLRTEDGFNDARIHEILGDEMMQRISNLTVEQKMRFYSALETRNGLVVEFNPVLTTLLGCNTNVSILGSDAQAKAIMAYLLKYMTKSPSELSHAISVIYKARQAVDKHPSQAPDTGTHRRTAMHMFTHYVNQLSTAFEVSLAIGSLALLGQPAEISSHGFQMLFANAALAYVLKKGNNLHNYDDFNDLTEDVFPLEKTSVSYPDNSDDDEEPEDLLLDYREQENATALNSKEVDVPPEEEDEHITANVYNSGKEKKAVLQVEHYAKRGKDLLQYSLYEYCAIVKVVEKPKPRIKKSGDDSTGPDVVDKATGLSARLGSMEGRTPNGTYEFHPSHPLYDTHYQRIRSKFKVPVLIRNPPKPPPPKPNQPSSEWKFAARNFARYFLTVYRPWLEEEGTLPGDMTWRSFCSWMKDLQFGIIQQNGERFGPTPLDTGRRRWIENASQGLRISAEQKIANQMHRNRRATRWNQSDDFSGHMMFVPHSRDEDDFDRLRLIENDAQTSIDLARMEARLDDPDCLLDDRYTQYNEDTEAVLRQVTAPWMSRQQKPPPISSEAASQMIYRGRSTDQPQTKDVFKALQEDLVKPTPPEDGSVDITDDQHVTTPAFGENPNEMEDLFDDLTVEQRRILRLCKTFFKERKLQIESGSKIRPKPLRFLVHGGPGTGKSFLTKRIKTLSERLNVTVECMAMTGIAAGIMPGGSTCHHKLCLPICDTNDKPKTLKPEKLIQMQRKMNSETLAMVIIDEISFVTPGTLSLIEGRLTELLGSDDVEGDKSFGGVGIVLMGDFFQMPPVPADTLFAAIINKYVRGRDVNKGSKECKAKSKTRENGAYLFRSFRKFELTQQMRAAEDPIHTAMLDQMRSPKKGQKRIPLQYIKNLKKLSAADVANDPEWATVPIIVTSNSERIHINNCQSERWSKWNRIPRICWKSPIEGDLAPHLSPQFKERIYKDFPQLTSYFVYGAPGYLSNNINPGRELSNGTAIVFEGLELDPREETENIHTAIITAGESEDVCLQYPPKYIIVSVPAANPNDFTGRTLVPGRVVIPVPVFNIPEKIEIQLPGRPKPDFIMYRSHAVEMRFAITVHKVQGQTCDKIIIQLNKRKFMPYVTFSMLYVSLSRVKKSENIRIIPPQPCNGSLDYLENLHPSEDLITWLEAFGKEDESGSTWNSEKAIDIHALKLQSTTTKDKTRGKKKSQSSTESEVHKPSVEEGPSSKRMRLNEY